MTNHEAFLRREAIKKRAAEGHKYADIAKEFGVSSARIWQIAGNRFGRLRFIWDEQSRDFARARWDAGLPAAEIAREMGVTKNCIIGLAHRNNFAARPSPIKRAA